MQAVDLFRAQELPAYFESNTVLRLRNMVLHE